MKQKDIDIYEILKDMPKGIELYTPMCGRVDLTWLATNKEAGEAIGTENRNGEFTFNKEGKYLEDGEVLLFPSNEMRDWSKFFKKGDVLEYKGENNCKGICIFESYEDDMTKLHFTGLYTLTKGKIREIPKSLRTADWVKSDDPAGYIKTVEEQLCGRLNLETLKIVKLKPKNKPVFRVGELYVFNEDDEDGVLTTIGNLIGKDESRDTLTFGNQYEIETEKFFACKGFGLRISLHKELREATEDEVELFSKHYSIWQEKEKKKAMSKCSFKPFDKVLVRCGNCNWLPAFFVRDRGEDFAARFNALPIHSGHAGDFTSCIPFEGHEEFAFTDYNFVDLPF